MKVVGIAFFCILAFIVYLFISTVNNPTSNAIRNPKESDINKVKESIRYFEKDGRCYAITFWQTLPVGYGHSITQVSCK